MSITGLFTLSTVLPMALDWLTQHTSLIRGSPLLFPENKNCIKMPHSLLNSSIITQLLWHWLQKLKLHLAWVYSMWPTLSEARFGMSSCIYDSAHVLIVSLSGTGKIPFFELCKTIFCPTEKKKKVSSFENIWCLEKSL